MALSLGLLTASFAYGQPNQFYELGPWASANLGKEPGGGVTLDAAGNLYGTATTGGIYGQGLVYEITKAGVVKDLHDFGDVTVGLTGITWDGALPRCAVAFDSKGNLYGTTLLGGANYEGEVWEVTSAGVYKDLHDFGGEVAASGESMPDGSAPTWGVSVDSGGNLYGTTSKGGAYSNYGTVWKFSSQGTYSVLHSFGGELGSGKQATLDGKLPLGGVTLDSSGNLYGAATEGGTNTPSGLVQGGGVLWKFSTSGAYSILHEFGGKITNAGGTSGLDGTYPATTITFDSYGNMYGLASKGGPYTTSGLGFGMLWRYTSTGSYQDLHDFGANIVNVGGGIGPDGAFPTGQVTIDKTGNLYGTATAGGASYAAGMIWERSVSHVYSDLHDFGSSGIWTTFDEEAGDGVLPNGTVTIDSAGNFYGTCIEGGNGGGCLWTLCNSVVKSLSVAPTSLIGGAIATATITLAGAAPIGGFEFVVSDEFSYTNNDLLIPGGATTGKVAITTQPTNTTETDTISFYFEGKSYSANVKIAATAISSLTLSPSSVKGGSSSTCTIKLNGPAPYDEYLSISSSSDYASPPYQVYVASGATSVQFTISTYSNTTGQNISATIEAETPGGSAASAVLTIK